MKKFMIVSALAALGSVAASAQAPGSESVYGGSTSVKSIITGGTSADVSESLYIGPGTHQIDGTWEIYAKKVIIDPLAVVTGTGTIQIYNPGDLISIYPAAVSVATLVDGNSPLIGAANTVDVDLKHFNNAGLQLTEMGFPADLIIDGWMNITNSSSLYVGKDLSLEVDGADVTLGTSGVTGDLRFDADATISNYRPSRMVITNNSILSHVVKDNFTTAFVFPVGIADGDYTPAQISNAAANTVRVSVQDYTASTSPEATSDPGPGGIAADGMNRTWHIYADNAGIASTINLQHNSSSNQTGFTDASHFVTQWGNATPNASGDFTVAFSSSPWQSNIAAAGATGTLLTGAATLSGSSMRSRAYSGLATSLTDETSYFTKSSDPFHPLPLQILSFSANTRDCDVSVEWQAANEGAAIRYELWHSTDADRFVKLADLAPQTQSNSYVYRHIDAGTGIHYYRLKVVEADQSITQSPTRNTTVQCLQEATGVKVYPNPTTDLLTVEGMSAKSEYTLRLLSADGKLIIEQKAAGSKAVLDIAQLPQAAYLLQLVEGGETKLNVRVSKM